MTSCLLYFLKSVGVLGLNVPKSNSFTITQEFRNEVGGLSRRLRLLSLPRPPPRFRSWTVIGRPGKDEVWDKITMKEQQRVHPYYKD